MTVRFQAVESRRINPGSVKQSGGELRKKVLIGTFVVALTLFATHPFWKTAAKQHCKPFLIASWIAYDTVGRSTFLKRLRGDGGEPGLGDPVTELRRIHQTFADYLRHAGIAEQDLRGKRVLELGPGSNIGVTLCFLAAGAAHVLANDKFVPLRDTAAHRDLYHSLRAQLSPAQQENFDGALRIGGALHPMPERLRYITGNSIEDFATDLPASSFDVIVSNDVLEEMYNPDAAFAAMDRLLRPGGYMVHRIDLRDYGMLSNYGYHPLEYLTISDSIYRFMAKNTGQPNRRLIDYYRRKVTEFGYSGECRVSLVLGHASELPEPKVRLTPGVDYTHKEQHHIGAIRDRFLPRFQRLSDEDLLIGSIVLVARKPQSTRPEPPL